MSDKTQPAEYVIIKYLNRRLYDRGQHKYIKLKDVRERIRKSPVLVRIGESLGNGSMRDCTVHVYASIIAAEVAEGRIPLITVMRLLRFGSIEV